MGTLYGEYESVIGLEVHAQLLTQTKAFCGCATSFGDPPNTHTCPVCLGLPGALPVLNREAVRQAASAAMALGCQVAECSVFARKNYFYPDLPKGYQISQYELPLAQRGAIEIEIDGVRRRAGILRVHMEEDAGKNVHGQGDDSIVDLNRAGTPLIEIVGDPDLRSPAEAAEYLKRLRELLMFLGVNDGNLEQGSFRCDANVSVRKVGETRLGTRTELKNINSFRFVAEAIDVEIRRQIALLERGERVHQQTRGYNADKRETYLLRDKENDEGYRYFPEPDLPPLVLDKSFIEDILDALPESPGARRKRMVQRMGLTPYAAAVLTSHPQIASFFDRTAALYTDAVKAANFIQSEVLRDVHPAGLVASFPVSPEQIAELLRLVDQGLISGKQAKEVYGAMKGTPVFPSTIVRDRGMSVITDEHALLEVASKLIEDNPKQAAGYRAGKANLLGFFVGQMMRRTGGSADPITVNRVLKQVLEGAPVSDTLETAAPLHAENLSGVRVSDSDGAVTRVLSAPYVPPSSLPTSEMMQQPREVASPLAQSVTPAPIYRARPTESTTLTSASGVFPLPLPPATPLEVMSLDVFNRLDLRVGIVLSAEPVLLMDDLLDLRIDLAEAVGPRRIIASIARSFRPEELVGMRVIVACNLEPRDFGKDIVSHGMILVTGPMDSLALVTTSKNMPPGARIK